jgi:hypothetical protein
MRLKHYSIHQGVPSPLDDLSMQYPFPFVHYTGALGFFEVDYRKKITA